MYSPHTSEGRRFEEIWEEKEKKLRELHRNVGYECLPFPSSSNDGAVRPVAFEAFLSLHTPSSVKFVFSTIAPSLGFLETRLTCQGFTVVSISPHGRLPSNTFVLEHSLASLPMAPMPLYKSPNCVVCGLTPVLSCLVSNLHLIGLEVSGLTVTTMQSLTGRGDSPYDSELCVGNMLPVGQIEDTEQVR
jgi:aspartate-semialdehyde dehydrogenase